jgi:hypothetical protein
VWRVWKWSPDVQVECSGRAIVVFRMGLEGLEGEVGMWYATACGPVRKMGRVCAGRGMRAWGRGGGVGLVRAIFLFRWLGF